MIIEDNVDANDSLAMLVEMMGFEVAQALDGPAALELAPRFAPDVIFCDVGLPGMDGYEVVRALRGVLAHQPVVAALTGYGDRSDLERATAAGFDQHFVKPLGHAQLESFLSSFGNSEARPIG
ncbi:MAG: response regulator [Burkholderiaceae bacterium]